MAERLTATVTLLFCDLVESTALASGLGDTAADELRHDVFDALRGEITAYRGTEVKNLGDGLMVSFASNADAVRSACGMQQKIDALGRRRHLPLALRIGISVGEATFEDDDWFGSPVIEAARLCASATSGQVLVADVVRVLLGSRAEVTLRPIGELTLKGLPDPVAACEVDWAPLVTRTLDLPLPRAFSIAPRFSLAGRDDEYEQVQTAWKEASTGARRAVLIAGEPGIGKTRLAAELGRAVNLDGGVVLLGRCDDGLGVPYQPFVEALAHVVGHAPESELTALLGPGAGELLRLVPELAQRLPGLAPTSSDPETERYLLFEAIAGWLEAQSQLAPTLLVLDDLHWAAEPTLLMLRHVLGSDRNLNLLVVGTYRDTEIDRTHPLGALLAHLRRTQGVDRIALRGLDGEGVADLVERASGQALNEQARELAAAVHAETGGNPFFAIEVLVSLAERGTIYQDAEGQWRSDLSIEEVGIPEGVKEVVGQRLSRLPPECNAVLHGAAVAGQDFELDVVAAVTADGEEGAIDALEAARVAGLIDELGGAPVRYRFAHALVQQTLLDEIPTARRLRLHRAIAEAIERLRADHLDRYRATLARHWYEAGTEPARALEASVVAAEQALIQFADREAYQWLTQAADLFDDADASPSTRVDVMTMTGEALRRIGDPTHREVLIAAGRLAANIGDGARMARAALANGRGWQSDIGGTDAERVAALEAALEALGDSDRATRALLLVRLAVETVYSSEPGARRSLVDEALTTARSADDRVAIATVLIERHNVLLGADTVELRRLGYTELLELTADLGDPLTQALSRSQGYFWRLERGDVAGAREDVRAYTEIIGRLGQPTADWIARWMQSSLAALAGDLDDGRTLLERALEIGTEAGIPDTLVFDATMRIWTLVDGGSSSQVADGRVLLDRIPSHYYDGNLYALALLEILNDNTEAARRLRDEAGTSSFAPWSESGGPADARLSNAANSACVDAALGEASAWTSAAYDLISRWPQQFYGSLVWNGPTETALAAIAPLAGHADDLDRLLATSLETTDKTTMPLYALYARLWGACGLRNRGGRDDCARVLGLIDEAIAIGDRIGAGIARAAAEHFPALRD